MPTNTYPFKRNTHPFVLPVKDTPTRFDMPQGYFTPGQPGAGSISFMVVNSFPFYVRLRGSSAIKDGSYKEVSEDLDAAPPVATGWLFPPGFVGVFTSQTPDWMSTMAVDRAGFPYDPTAKGSFEISYGGGA